MPYGCRLLLMHSFLFGKAAHVVQSELPWFVLRPTNITSRNREAWFSLFAVLSALCGLCGALRICCLPFQLVFTCA